MLSPRRPGAASLLTLAPRDFNAECERAIAAARAQVAKIKEAHAAGDRAAVLAAYDAATATLGDARARAILAENVHPDPARRGAAERGEQALGAFAVDLSLDRDVYDALTAVDVSGEDDATRHRMERTRLEFRRAGVDGDDAIRARVKALRRGRRRHRRYSRSYAGNRPGSRVGQRSGDIGSCGPSESVVQ